MAAEGVLGLRPRVHQGFLSVEQRFRQKELYLNDRRLDIPIMPTIFGYFCGGRGLDCVGWVFRGRFTPLTEKVFNGESRTGKDKMRGFFAALRMTNERQKQIPFGNDKQKNGQRQGRAHAARSVGVASKDGTAAKVHTLPGAQRRGTWGTQFE